MVGERGVTLSGGQKQRVAIARMLMQKAPIMVFDDSLSAVDAETDVKIRHALKERMGKSTVILISHRVTTLMQADCILVLEDGRVAQMGTHQQADGKDGRDLPEDLRYSDECGRRAASSGGGETAMRIEEQEYTKNFDIRIWKRVLPFLAPFKGCVAVMLIFNLICSLVDIVMPLFQRYAIDHFIGQGSLAGIWKFGAVYALVVLGQFLSVVCFTRASAVLEMSVGKTMKRACFVHLQELSFSYYNVTPVGYILSRVMSDTDRIAGMVAWNVSDMLWAFVYVLGVFVAMSASELEAGADHHADCAGAGHSHLVFPE
ncbi:MAG: ABC transporter transmembrane domain-containing protein [Lachnospiraceae bacterium]